MPIHYMLPFRRKLKGYTLSVALQFPTRGFSNPNVFTHVWMISYAYYKVFICMHVLMYRMKHLQPVEQYASHKPW